MQLDHIQSLYLNTHGADVWFIINDERIPGHKVILAMCPYYHTMFYGSLLPENDEVNMTDAVQSVQSFKEFLKFMYMREPNLTIDNIEDVISLAKQSLSDKCLSVCEMFLKDALTADNIFLVYKLALLYEIDSLKAACEDEICVFAEKVLESSSLSKLPYEYLQMVLQRDALACEEVDVFNACMVWAKSACKQNNLDPSNGKCLRDQIRDCVYQIRFTSMTKEDASNCISLYPGLFTADELEEIICMIALGDKFKPKQFNWTPRYFDLDCYKGRYLQFSIVEKYNEYASNIAVDECETTRFSCNRRVLLKSFYCQIDSCLILPIYVSIIESRNNENEIVRYGQQMTAEFKVQSKKDPSVYEAEIELNKPILLRPNYCYEIRFEFDSFQYVSPHSYSIWATKKRIDHDVVFHFEKNRIVSGLSCYRFDNKNYLQKVFYNPKTWMILAGVGAVAFLGSQLTAKLIFQPSVPSVF